MGRRKCQITIASLSSKYVAEHLCIACPTEQQQVQVSSGRELYQEGAGQKRSWPQLRKLGYLLRRGKLFTSDLNEKWKTFLQFCIPTVIQTKNNYSSVLLLPYNNSIYQFCSTEGFHDQIITCFTKEVPLSKL